MAEQKKTSGYRGKKSSRGKPSGGGSGGRRGGGRGGYGNKRRDRRPKRRSPPEWIPKTSLGQAVKSGLITDINQIFEGNFRIQEYQIVDLLIGNVTETVADICMTQRQTDAGQMSTFKAVVAVGNQSGFVGIATSKNKEVGPAIRKGIQIAKVQMFPVKRGCGSWECNCGGDHSIPYVVEGKCSSVNVKLKPAAKGTGLVASDAAKIPLKLAGIKDCYVYIKGNSKNSENTVKAIVDALKNAYKIMAPSDWSR